MSDRPFDMPATGASFEARGGWVVRRLMAEFGLADFQAAGLVGNLGYESGGFATLQEISPLVQGSAGGFGWAQWTGSRRRAFEAWCTANHLPMASDEANYGYLLAELHGAYSGTIAGLKSQRTLGAAVFSVGQTYERPSGTTADHLPGYQDRLDYAKRALTGFHAAAAMPQDTKPIDPGQNPVELCKAMQRILGVDDDGDPGPLTRAAIQDWRAAHPGVSA